MTNDPTLENALKIEPVKENEWQCIASKDYEANNGMFGGWTVAMLLRSVIDNTQARGEPASITVNFLSRIEAGAKLTINTQLLKSGRSFSHWQTQISRSDNQQLLAIAFVILADRQLGGGFVESEMPQVPGPAGLPTFQPPGGFGQRSDIGVISGIPPLNQPDSSSVTWTQEISSRKIDAIQLAYLCDSYPPRIWYGRTKMCPMATVSLSLYFFATQQELEEAGTGHVLIDAIGTRGESSIYGSRANMWSENRVLLATTEQLGWYKD